MVVVVVVAVTNHTRPQKFFLWVEICFFVDIN